MVRDYELVMLVSPQVADPDVPKVVDKVKEFVTSHGGQVASVNPWGRRRLAYHIADFEEASYVQANFNLEPKHVAELEGNLRITEDVIRHMVVRVQ